MDVDDGGFVSYETAARLVFRVGQMTAFQARPPVYAHELHARRVILKPSQSYIVVSDTVLTRLPYFKGMTAYREGKHSDIVIHEERADAFVLLIEALHCSTTSDLEQLVFRRLDLSLALLHISSKYGFTALQKVTRRIVLGAITKDTVFDILQYLNDVEEDSYPLLDDPYENDACEMLLRRAREIDWIGLDSQAVFRRMALHLPSWCLIQLLAFSGNPALIPLVHTAVSERISLLGRRQLVNPEYPIHGWDQVLVNCDESILDSLPSYASRQVVVPYTVAAMESYPPQQQQQPSGDAWRKVPFRRFHSSDDVTSTLKTNKTKPHRSHEKPRRRSNPETVHSTALSFTPPASSPSSSIPALERLLKTMDPLPNVVLSCAALASLKWDFSSRASICPIPCKKFIARSSVIVDADEFRYSLLISEDPADSTKFVCGLYLTYVGQQNLPRPFNIRGVIQCSLSKGSPLSVSRNIRTPGQRRIVLAQFPFIDTSTNPLRGITHVALSLSLGIYS